MITIMSTCLNVFPWQIHILHTSKAEQVVKWFWCDIIILFSKEFGSTQLSVEIHFSKINPAYVTNIYKIFYWCLWYTQTVINVLARKVWHFSVQYILNHITTYNYIKLVCNHKLIRPAETYTYTSFSIITLPDYWDYGYVLFLQEQQTTGFGS